MTDVRDTLTVTRVLHAPRENVWRAWTEPDELARWWWPARFQTTYTVDLRPGGGYAFRSADLPDMGVLAVSGTYLEVTPPERLVYTWEWEGEDAAPTQVTVEFVDLEAETEVRVTHTGFSSRDAAENHLLGWTHCLDRLEHTL